MPKRSHFGLREKHDREREREERKSNLSSAISRGFTGQNSVGRQLRLLYATRATLEYWNHKFSPRSKVQVFTEIKKKTVSQETTLIEVGFLFYSV